MAFAAGTRLGLYGGPRPARTFAAKPAGVVILATKQVLVYVQRSPFISRHVTAVKQVLLYVAKDTTLRVTINALKQVLLYVPRTVFPSRHVTAVKQVLVYAGRFVEGQTNKTFAADKQTLVYVAKDTTLVTSTVIQAIKQVLVYIARTVDIDPVPDETRRGRRYRRDRRRE